MLREEGGGGVEEGSRVVCVETNGVRCCAVRNVTTQNVALYVNIKQYAHSHRVSIGYKYVCVNFYTAFRFSLKLASIHRNKVTYFTNCKNVIPLNVGVLLLYFACSSEKLVLAFNT